LKRIKRTGDIFFAISDREWILDGANVHVSLIGFDDRTEKARTLNGAQVPSVNSNLTAVADITGAVRLAGNRGIGYIADVKAGKFEMNETAALAMIRQPNPHRRPNSDVIVPWINSLDILRRPRRFWIVDFGDDTSESMAARYEQPFRKIRTDVYPLRAKVKRKSYREYWWLHAEPCAEMRRQIAPLKRYLVTTTVSKHRVFAWRRSPTLPDHQLVAFAREDDYFFGILHSRSHEVWARAQGTQVRERESGFRYTPTTCFETFPSPEATTEQKIDISAAAKELNELRENWLNPPEWTTTRILEFPGATDGPWSRFVADPDERRIGTVRYPRVEPRDDECAKRLAKRTLTNLYNERPAWLAHAHARLDAAVATAYGLDPDLTDEQILEKLLALNIERANDETKSAAKQRNGKKISRMKSEHEMI
jgi:hypothetical protein